MIYNDEMTTLVTAIGTDMKLALSSSGSGSVKLGQPSDEDNTKDYFYFGYPNHNIILRQNKLTGENKLFKSIVYSTSWNDRETLAY